jgi:hypothetical protein
MLRLNYFAIILYMAKYAIKDLNLPCEVIDFIYSFIDPYTYIKQLPEIWFKRLVDKSLHYYPEDKESHPYLTKLFLRSEATQLRILLKNNGNNLIKTVHYKNLQILEEYK